MRTITLGTLSCVLLALLAAAPVTARADEPKSRSDDTIAVTVLPDNTYQIDERIYAPNQLRKALRGMGATKTTLIEVAIAADTTRDAIVAIGRDFATAGYGMVVFVRPRRVEAYSEPVEPPATTSPAPAAVTLPKANKRK